MSQEIEKIERRLDTLVNIIQREMQNEHPDEVVIASYAKEYADLSNRLKSLKFSEQENKV